MSTVFARRTPHRTALALSATLTLVAGTLVALGQQPASAATPEPSLHYTMDDIIGSTLPDVSGNGLDGTISGQFAVIDSDDDGSALDLLGGSNGGYVTLPRGALADADDLTVSVRTRWDGVGGSWQWLYALGTNTTRYLFSTPSNADGRLRTAITTGGGGGETQITGSAALPVETWLTLTVTLDTTAERLSTYLDGVLVSSAPTQITAGQLLTAQAGSAGMIGRSFYADPRYDGAIDDFRIYRTALTDEQVAELVVGDVPELTDLVEDAFAVATTVGTAPPLPQSARGAFTDGYDRDVPVVWDEIDPTQYAERGTFEVEGRVAGRPVTATVRVHRGELRVDLATNTGDFKGGASGLLYGLYADGMPTDNLVEGMNVRTVATKAQDGAQHPGSDALEVLEQLADATDGDVYLRVTDYYRGFPYQWPGSTPEEKLADYARVLDEQLAMVVELAPEYRDNLVIEPFNEPEGNMFGTGQWSLNRTSWLNDPTDYFAAWDETYRAIKAADPDLRIAGPGTSILFPQVQGFMEHVVAEGTVPDIITWHELTHPQAIRESVERFRDWEAAAFSGTELEGTQLPININEYAFNYHTSVPGQMIQWISAIEDTKVDAMIAFWNINGNLSDSAVQANRGNGQWWLYNAYARMTGHTVDVTPPFPGENYTVQGVGSLDEGNAIARAIVGGGDGAVPVEFVNVPDEIFGDQVRVFVREIAWTGQIGDSAQPAHVAELVVPVADGTVAVEFDGGTLPPLTESSAYEIVLTPAGHGEQGAATPTLWQGSYEAEDATYTGSGYSLNGPEGSPSSVGNFFTSGGYNVGGLRTGSDGVLDFTVEVPQDGTYDLSVFASTLNTFGPVAEQGPTNVFLRVDGVAEQELFLPLGYKWVVWDHADTTVELTAGTHTISLAAQSLDGAGATQGDAIIDRITLSLANPVAASEVYEAELADIGEGRTVYTAPDGVDPATVSGSGAVELTASQSATFWVYGAQDAEATVSADLLDAGSGTLAVNGHAVLDLSADRQVAVALEGGVNKMTVTAGDAGLLLDRLVVGPGNGVLPAVEYQAEDAEVTGTAGVVDLSLAEGGKAVSGIGGEPGNDNTLAFRVDAQEAGPHAVVVRFANPEQVPGTHYNPNPLGRHADISVNGGEARRVMFVPTFHENNFWERTVVLDLETGQNTIVFAAEELPNWDGTTYAADNWPGILLRANQAPVLDRITVSPLAAAVAEDPSLNLAVTVETRCLVRTAYLAVTVRNDDAVPVDVQVTTPYGSRAFSAVAPGTNAFHSFTTRSANVPGAEVTVEAESGVSDATYTQTLAFDARSCG